MADRFFQGDPRELEREICHLRLAITLGASGAIASQVSIGASAVKGAGAGEYTVTLEDRYPAFRGFSFALETPAAADSHVELRSKNLATRVFSFRTVTAGAEANLASGAIIYLDLYMKNTDTNP